MLLSRLLFESSAPHLGGPAAGYDELEFDVLGDPAAQGSKMAWVNPKTGRAQMREQAGAKLDDWRSTCAAAARGAAIGHLAAPFDGPLRLTVVFRFPVTKGRAKRCAKAGGMLPKETAPDLDKLVRALGDSLKAGGLIHDDARIWQTTASKVEVAGWTGCTVWLCYREDR